MTEFKTKVELDLTLDRDDNYEIDTHFANLRWTLEMEMRQYGIKSFDITVPDQKITVNLIIWGDEEDTEETLTLDVKDVIVERSGDFDGLVPRSLELYDGKWKVVFG